MSLVRTNVTLPAEVLATIDEVAGPRGRSAYIAEVLAKQVRRDRARKIWREKAGVLAGSNTWGRTDEEVLETLRRLRAQGGERVDQIWRTSSEPVEGESMATGRGRDNPRERKAMAG